MRTLLSTFAIGLGVTMMLTLVGLSHGMLDDQARRTRGVGADVLVRPPGSSVIGLSSAPMNERLLTEFVAHQPYVAIATGTVVHGIGGTNTVTGIDFDSFSQMSGGFKFIEGGRFDADFEIIVDEFYARQHNLHAGSITKLMEHDWKVVGVVEPGKLARMFVPIRQLQNLTGNTGKLSVIFLKLKNPAETHSVVQALKAKLPDYPIFSMEEFTSQFSVNSLPELRTFISVITGVSVMFGFLIVFLAMYTAVLERTREIGILKALGATPGMILGILIRETALLALLGSVAGILLSFVSRALINGLVPGSLTQAVVPIWWPISAGFTLLGAMLGVIYPAMKAARQDALESLSYE